MQPYFTISLLFALGGGLAVESCKTVVGVVEDAPQFSVLAEALRLANLTGVLDDEAAQVTVFAPTNAAFSKTVSSIDLTPEALLGDVGLLTNILLTHIVPEVIKDFNNASKEVSTLIEDEELTLEGSINGHVSVLSGNIVSVLDNSGIWACQAVVYPIDGMLIPSLLDLQDPQAYRAEDEKGMEQLYAQGALTGDSASSVAGRCLLAE